MRATTSTIRWAVAAGLALVTASGGIAWAVTGGGLDPSGPAVHVAGHVHGDASGHGRHHAAGGHDGWHRWGSGAMGRGSVWRGDLVGDDAVATAADQASLARVAEEERMARDLYREFADAWDVRGFTVIARAEQHHLDTVEALMDAYGLEDRAGDEAGVYADAALQARYDALLARGSESEIGALAAAALVEETDIADLRAQDVDSDAIAALYARLEAASERHLAAFVSALDARGEAYEPTALDPAEVADITGVPAP